jgi:hypothetical protein
LTVAQVDDEEKSPFRFGNPRFRRPELIAEHPDFTKPSRCNIPIST